MNRSFLFLSILAAASLTACGGGGDSSENSTSAPVPVQPTGPSIGTVAGIYANDALPATSRMVIDEDGNYWSIAVDSVPYASVAGVGAGTAAVNSNGTFTAGGTTYLMNSVSVQWDDISVTGNVVDKNRLSFTSRGFGETSTGSATRLPTSQASGAIPSKTYSATQLVAFTVGYYPTALGASFTVNGSSISGNSNGCTFSGSVKDSGLGYAKISMKFANNSYCLHPGETIYGVAGYDSTQQTLVFILRMDPAPYKIYLGLAQ